MNQTLSIGPVLLPAFLPALLAGYLLARILSGRLKKRYPSESEWFSDRFSTAILIGFVIWKLWPLTRWANEILKDPVILLRLPGGRTGAIFGILAAVAFLAFGVLKNRRRSVPVGVGLAGFGTGFLFAIAVIETVAATPPVTEPSEVLNLTVEYVQKHSGEDTIQNAGLVTGTRPGVITFWATWCGPCEAELPVKKRFYSEFRETVDFVAVNLTTSEQSVSRVTQYIEAQQIPYPIALDRTGTLSGIFNILGTPTTIVLAPDGREITRWTGPASLDRLERAVDEASEQYSDS